MHFILVGKHPVAEPDLLKAAMAFAENNTLKCTR
jgi:hypothetical protein